GACLGTGGGGSSRAGMLSKSAETKSSLVDDGKGANWGARTALEFQRHAEELKLAFAQKFFEIHQPFPMADAELAAEPVLREHVIGRPVGRRTFHPVHTRAAVIHPLRRFDRELRVLPHRIKRRIRALVEAGAY